MRITFSQGKLQVITYNLATINLQQHQQKLGIVLASYYLR